MFYSSFSSSSYCSTTPFILSNFSLYLLSSGGSKRITTEVGLLVFEAVPSSYL